MHRRWRLGVALALALALAAPTATARADDAPADPRRTEARDLAGRGDAEFAKGRCDLAVPVWRQAQTLFPAPTLLLRIARCQALLGQVLEASATLQAILEQPLAEGVPEAFIEAHDEAASTLPRVQARIGSVQIDIPGGSDATLVVELDDSPAPVGRPIPSNPGSHNVRIRAGSTTWESNVVVEEGQARVVTASVVVHAQVPDAPAQRTVGYVLGGAGLVAVVVGSLVGATALSTANTLAASCGPDRTACPPSAQGDIDGLRTRSLVTDITLGGGAALVIAGAVVIFTTPPSRELPPRLEIVAGAPALFLRGSF